MKRLFAAATLILASNAAHADCTVADSSGTPLNVRTAPNGMTIGTLNNGRAVRIIDSATDEKGRAWAYVSDRATAKPIGWVFREYVACDRAASSSEAMPEALVPQFGNASDPEVIEWSPDGRWFLTATRSDVVLWDPTKGDVLRTIDLPEGTRAIGIADDGRAIVARGEAGEISAWRAETGVPVKKADLDRTAKWLPDFDAANERKKSFWGEEARRFVNDRGLKSLIAGDIDRINVFEPDDAIVWSKVGDSVLTSLISLKDHAVRATFTDYHNGSCGDPEIFAFHGHRLAIAPGWHDATEEWGNAEVYTVGKGQLKLAWRHRCRGFRDSAIGMERGLIVSWPQLDRENIWDPLRARPLHLNKTVDSERNAEVHRKMTYDFDARKAASPDGRYQRDREKRRTFSTIRDTRTNDVVLSGVDIHFADDSQHAWKADDKQSQSITLWNLQSGHVEWRATEVVDDRPYLVVEFPDGKFRLAPGAEKIVRVVKGFVSRPFTHADATKFLK